MKTSLSSLALILSFAVFGCTQVGGAPETKPEGPGSPSAELQTESVLSVIDLEVKLDELVTTTMETEHLPGVAVVIVHKGKTLLKKGYGYANALEEEQVDPEETIFRIGSISKPLTILALTKLIENERLSLDDPIDAYLEGLGDIPNTSGSIDPITIWHLMTHTSGFDQIGVGRFDPDLGKDIDLRIEERPSLSEFLASSNLRRTVRPGSHYRYDTYGITLAGHILEKVTGQTYADAMNELLFAPSGMEDTYVGVAPQARNRMASGHGWLEPGYGIAAYEIYNTQPASSIDATPADMAKLMQVLTGKGQTAEGLSVFDPKTVEVILSPQYRPHPDFPGVAYGFNDLGGFQTNDGYRSREIGHGGTMFGFQSSLTIYPEHDLAVFVTTNRNFETGGGPVSLNSKVEGLIRSEFVGDLAQVSHAIPEPVAGYDFTPYEGTYFFDLYCHTCTQQELNNGAWRRGEPVEIVSNDGALFLRGKRYLPTYDEGVFVSDDGQRKVFFRRHAAGQVTSFSWINSQEAFIKSN